MAPMARGLRRAPSRAGQGGHMCSRARRCASLVAAVLSLSAIGACSRPGGPEATVRRDENPKEQVVEARTIASGTSLVFSVDERISTATHARGDIFSATLRHGVTDVTGDEAIPEGVPSQWIVAEASTEGGETVLAVRLESIRVNGSWTPLVGDVTEAHVRMPSGGSTTTSP